jgi:hypothetical protein
MKDIFINISLGFLFLSMVIAAIGLPYFLILSLVKIAEVFAK